MYRHWGHPTADETAGCQRLREIVDTRTSVNLKTINQMVALMIKHICVSFIGVHNRWPKIDTTKTLLYLKL